MIAKKIGIVIFIFLTLFITCDNGMADVSAPVLKWQYGGCYSSWCEKGWYSSPAVADLDNDGFPEVIFTSWLEKGSNLTGNLFILNYQGNLLQKIDIPFAYSDSKTWNGSMTAPTLANIDNDPDLEIVLNTANSGFVAFDLPDTANAKIFWSTGRGSYLRTGSNPTQANPVCSGDFNEDDDVDGSDLAEFAAEFNTDCLNEFAAGYGQWR